MRDAKWTIAGATRCQNSTSVGYSKTSVVSGDWIVYDDETGHGCFTARVLGRLTVMPNDGLEDCTGWLLVYQLAASLTYGYLRWVNPTLVREAYDRNRVRSCVMYALDQTTEQLFDDALK